MSDHAVRIRSHRRARALLAGVLLMGAWPVAADSDERMAAATECTREDRRLERLACFDEVFGTPLAKAPEQTRESLRPESWRQAYQQERKRKSGDGPLHRNTRTAGHLLTIPALGTRPPRPLLMIQCHNNITELSLILPSALSEERLRLGFSGNDNPEPQLWRVRDEGFVASAGRGLPSIRTALQLARLEDTTLSSGNSAVDGLMFDLSGLAGTLTPLRDTCGW